MTKKHERIQPRRKVGPCSLERNKSLKMGHVAERCCIINWILMRAREATDDTGSVMQVGHDAVRCPNQETGRLLAGL